MTFASVGIPRLPAPEILRPALEAALDTPSPLIVVTGPSGMGKTTLVAQWAERRLRRDQVVVWIALSEEMTDERSIWPVVARQLAVAAGRGAPLDQSATHALRRIRDEVALLDVQVVLVFDNFRFVSDMNFGPSLLGLIRDLRQTKAVVVSRVRTPFERLSASGAFDVDVIGAQALRFTAAQSAQLVEAIAGEKVDRAQAVDFGLPLLARLAGVAVRNGEWSLADSAVGREVVSQAYFETLTDELPDPEMLRALCRIAVPDLVTRDYAAASVAGLEALGWAERLGLGLWEHDEGSGEVFVLSAIVRDVLLRILRERYASDVGRVHRAAAHDAIDHGRAVEAMRNALHIRDFYLASRIVQRFWTQLAFRQSGATAQVLGTVPLGVVGKFPLLSILMGFALGESGQEAAARPYFEAALQTSIGRAKDPCRVQRVWAHATLSAASRKTGKSEAAAGAARRGLEAIRAMTLAERAELGPALSDICALFGRSLLAAAAFPEAIASFERGIASAERAEAGYRNGALLALSYALRGDVDQADEALRDLGRWAREADGERTSLDVPASLARALVDLEEGDVGAAERALARARETSGSAQYLRLLDYCDLALLLASGRAEEAVAQAEFRRGSGVPASASPDPAVDEPGGLHFLALCATGRRAAAVRLLEQLPSYLRTRPLLGAYRALLDSDWERAFVLSAKEKGGAAATADRRHQVLAKLVYAVAARHLGRLEAARQTERNVAAVMQKRRIRTPLALIPARERAVRESLADHSPWLAGKVDVSASVSPPLLPPAASLSRRELLVLGRLSDDASIVEIARDLNVSPNTVKTQLRSIYRKLHVGSRAEAIMAAAERGYLPPLGEMPAWAAPVSAARTRGDRGGDS